MCALQTSTEGHRMKLDGGKASPRKKRNGESTLNNDSSSYSKLDVSLVVTWAYLRKLRLNVNFLQLYIKQDEKKLTQNAFDYARSIDHSLALPWASMSVDMSMLLVLSISLSTDVRVSDESDHIRMWQDVRFGKQRGYVRMHYGVCDDGGGGGGGGISSCDVDGIMFSLGI
ncbi:hypothetical protein Tco_0681011 [Tanacetum coccineum]|uniref:Uncharacterized protein n=1 Tax=Tanacetum coccineum TaxID=301880 RepID=A0ABQ4XNS0_9ASTR